MLEHQERAAARAAALGLELSDEAYVFSRTADGSEHPLPDSVGQRFRKLAARLNIKTSVHKLRHYSATELIAGGVDVRTVAGRLGHGSGGTTTLRTYAAWVSEADQRAAGKIAGRMPPRPVPSVAVTLPEIQPTSPTSESRFTYAIRSSVASCGPACRYRLSPGSRQLMVSRPRPLCAP
jgi:integrase